MISPRGHQSESDSKAEDLSHTERLGRRTFLIRGGAALATAAALAGLPFALRKELTQETSFVLFSAQQRQAVSAVQEHLFPHEPDSPGSTDINAATYLEWAITAPGIDPDTKNTIVNGVGRLRDASRERSNVLFNELNFELCCPTRYMAAIQTRSAGGGWNTSPVSRGRQLTKYMEG